MSQEKVYIDRIKYDIIDHCNLSCRHCSHFSPFRAKREVDLEHIKTDLTQINDRIIMDEFHIFGGEPLLHSNIIGVLRAAREILGDKVRIHLLTNGVKLPSMKDSFFIAVKHLNIIIEFTQYPIGLNFKKIEKNIELRGLAHIIRITNTFYNFIDPKGEQDGAESFRVCKAYCSNTYFENNRLYTCSYAKSVLFVNKQFNHNIEHDFISIDESSENITRYLNQACPTCRFCKVNKQPEPWTQIKPHEKV